MNIKVAKLFATMGFDIDTKDLNKLDQHLKSIRGNTALLSRNLRIANTQLNTTASRMRSLAKASETVTKFNNLGGKYVSLATKVRDSEVAIAKFGRLLKIIEPRLDSVNFRLSSVTRSYLALASAVRQANSAISQTPNRPPRVAPPYRGGSGGTGGGGYGGSGASGSSAWGLGAMITALQRFSPTGLMSGGAVTGAVALNEVRKAGQDQTRMENLLLFSTKSQEEYARSLEFVRTEAKRLGLNSVELGKAFAQVNMSARQNLTEDQRRKMFTDMSEYIMVTGAGQEDQKLIFKAVNQMFSLGRIMAEEMNQLTERGVPRQMIYDVAKDIYGVGSTEEVLDLQKKGKLDPSKILPEVFKRFSTIAKDTGAYDKMLNSSIYQQNLFMENLRQASAIIMESGLDKFFSTIFKGLNKALPAVMTFVKGVMGAVGGLTDIVGVIWDFIKSLGTFTGENPKTIASLSALVLVLALVADWFSKSTTNLSSLTKAFQFIIKRVPIIAFFLALWYLFKEYDKYMKGEDSWMADFADWMIYLIESTRLWKNEVLLAWQQVRDLDWQNLMQNSVMPNWTKDASTLDPRRKSLEWVTPLWRMFGMGSSLDIPTNDRSNASAQTASANSPVMVEGMAKVDVYVHSDGRVVRQERVVAPMTTINTNGLRGV